MPTCAFEGESGPCGHDQDLHSPNFCWHQACREPHRFLERPLPDRRHAAENA